MNCRACLDDPQCKKTWGCEEPTQNVVWELEEDVFYSCPMLWLTENIIHWYDDYAYYSKFTGAAPKIDELTPSWLDAMKYYDQKMEYYRSIKKPKSNDRTSQGLATLRHGFANRGK